MIVYTNPIIELIDSMDEVFEDAAYRACTKKLTSLNSLTIPGLRAFDNYVKTQSSTLSRQDVIDGLDWEFQKQRSFYMRLEELQKQFTLLDIRFTIKGPVQSGLWPHGPSNGTKLPCENGTHLYAFPLCPTQTAYQHHHNEPVIYIDEHVVITIPTSAATQNVALLDNQKLLAPLATYPTPTIEQPKGFFAKWKKTPQVTQRLERHPNFIFADLLTPPSTGNILEWFHDEHVDAVIVADRNSGLVTIHTPEELPKLHQEIRQLHNKELKRKKEIQNELERD